MDKNNIKQFCNINGYFASYSGHTKKWYIGPSGKTSAKITKDELCQFLVEKLVNFEMEELESTE